MILVIFLAGSADRIFVSFGIPYQTQVVVLPHRRVVLPASPTG